MYLVRAADRAAGIGALFEEAGIGLLAGKRVPLKANYNSDDPFPASTICPPADDLRLVPLDPVAKSAATEIRRILDVTG